MTQPLVVTLGRLQGNSSDVVLTTYLLWACVPLFEHSESSGPSRAFWWQLPGVPACVSTAVVPAEAGPGAGHHQSPVSGDVVPQKACVTGPRAALSQMPRALLPPPRGGGTVLCARLRSRS